MAFVRAGDLRRLDFVRSGLALGRHLPERHLLGNVLIFASCLGNAFNNTYSKKLLEILSPVELLVYSFLVSDVALFAGMMFFERPSLAQLAAFGFSVWMNLVIIAIFSLSVSMVLVFWVIQRIDVTQASFSIYLLPVFGVLFPTMVLHERITFQLLAGGTLVF